MSYEGIPGNIDLDFVKQWVRPRTSEKRFNHVVGVASVAARLAKQAGEDVFLAELCGWLHDACKEIKDKQLVAMAKEYGLPLDSILERNGHLLHGPVAAEVAKRELGITNVEVYRAIAEHTLGAVPMSQLSKVVFLADCLEASRLKSYTDPIWAALDVDGACDLDKAIVVATDEGLKFIIDEKKLIHPLTISVRNHYLDLIKDNSRSPSPS